MCFAAIGLNVEIQLASQGCGKWPQSLSTWGPQGPGCVLGLWCGMGLGVICLFSMVLSLHICRVWEIFIFSFNIFACSPPLKYQIDAELTNSWTFFMTSRPLHCVLYALLSHSSIGLNYPFKHLLFLNAFGQYQTFSIVCCISLSLFLVSIGKSKWECDFTSVTTNGHIVFQVWPVECPQILALRFNNLSLHMLKTCNDRWLLKN